MSQPAYKMTGHVHPLHLHCRDFSKYMVICQNVRAKYINQQYIHVCPPWSSSPQPWPSQLSTGSSSPKQLGHTGRRGSPPLPPASSQPSKDQPPADKPHRSPGAAAGEGHGGELVTEKCERRQPGKIVKCPLPVEWCCGWPCRWWSRCRRGSWTSLSACLRTGWSPGFHPADCAPCPGRLGSTPPAPPRLVKQHVFNGVLTWAVWMTCCLSRALTCFGLTLLFCGINTTRYLEWGVLMGS